MEKIQLSENVTLSRLVFGVWRLADWSLNIKERRGLIDQVLETGITSFDHADIYGGYTCEALFGAVIKENPAVRDKMQLISKCGIKLVSPNRPEHNNKYYDTSYDHIRKSVENSLKQLHTDHLDLLLIHRPNPLINPEEVARAFSELLHSGKVLAFGVSNFSPTQFEALSANLEMPLVTNQVEISALCLDQFKNGIIDHAQKNRYAPMAWSPLSGGSIFSNESPRAKRVNAVLQKMSTQLGHSIDELLYAWLLNHPSKIIPILGTGKIERVHRAANALDINLNAEQWFQVWEASEGEEVP